MEKDNQHFNYSPTSLLEEASQILGPFNLSESDHDYQAVTCPLCKDAWKTIAEALQKHSNTEECVQQIIGAYPRNARFEHPTSTCIDCEGCALELEMAYQTVLLGSMGLSQLIMWGPPHRTNTKHPQNYQDCPSCTKWVSNRTDARKILSANGYDPSAVLGSDEVSLQDYTKQVDHE